MRALYILTATIAFFVASNDAHAILQLQFSGNSVSGTIDDNGAGDTNAATGVIDVDLATVAGFGTWGGGTSFAINATSVGTSGSGEIHVTADYNFAGGSDFTPITVSAADLFVVQGAPIDFFTHDISVTETTPGDQTTAITRSEGFFSTALPDPGPLDPFDFVNPDSYENSITLAPPSAFPPPQTLTQTNTGGFIYGGAATTSLRTRLRVANTFTVLLSNNAAGTVQSNTIVNPEPVSLLLSSFGASAFGLGYIRRRKSKVNKA